MSSGGSALTDEQRARIEENKRKALARKQAKLQQSGLSNPPIGSVTSFPKTSFSSSKATWKETSNNDLQKKQSNENTKGQNLSLKRLPPPWKITSTNQNQSSTAKAAPPWISGSSADSAQTVPHPVAHGSNTSPWKPTGNCSSPPTKQPPPWIKNSTAITTSSNSMIPTNKPMENTNTTQTSSTQKAPWLEKSNQSTGQTNTQAKPPWLKKPNSSGSSRLSKGPALKRPASPVKPSITEQVLAGLSPPKMSKSSTVKGKCVLISRMRFLVEVGYSAVLINTFKSMETKQYDPDTRKWSFDLSEYPQLMQKVKPLSPEIFVEPLPACVLHTFSAHIQGRAAERRVPEADLSLVDAKLVEALMPFQRDGVNFCVSRRGRALIADDMGLGKTLQAITVATYYRAEWPLLVVVPSSVRFAWREQLLKWVPSLDPQQINVVVSGKESCTSGLVNILSYDLMVKHKDALERQRFSVVIMDESHHLKSGRTARTRAALPLLRAARRVLLLSGTPALSRPSELFQQINAIDPKTFPKFHDFGVRYCDGKQNPWGWDFNGSSNLAELQIVLEERIMIRRMKKDVLRQLPSKVRQMVILDPGSVKNNKSMKVQHKMVDKLKGSDRRGALLEYFHETGAAKVKAVREYVVDLLEAGGRKLLVFAHHQEVLDALEEEVTAKDYGYIRIDGRTSAEQRNFLAEKFQKKDKVQVAILSIMAANAGLNLTAASLVVFAELFWNPGVLVQAEDRAHRIGQEDSVTVHYLVAAGTADDYVWPLVQAKLDVLSRAGLTKDDFSEADTKRVLNPEHRDIMSYFEESFMEEDVMIAEETDTDDVTKNSEVREKTQPSVPASSMKQKSPAKQKSLFSYFSASCKEKTNEENASLGQSNQHHEDIMDTADWTEDLDAAWIDIKEHEDIL